MPDPILSENAAHHDAEELLPWYATGQLEDDERAMVEAHVSSCAHCRRQLAFERRMVDEFSALTPEVDSGWLRLKERLQSPQHALRQRRSPKVAWPQPRGERSSVWQVFTRPAVAAIAFAQLGFLIVAASVLISLSRPSYHALGSAPPPSSANVLAMFRADTTESQIRALLRSNDASLVGGPTPADAYLLTVPARSRGAVLKRLQADRHVLVVQPIDGARS